MRSRMLIMITVMTLLATFLTFFHSNVSARSTRPISQTGANAQVGLIPTVVAVPVVPAVQAPAQPQAPAPAPSYAETAPLAPEYDMDLSLFAQTVMNGAPNQVVGVYVPGTLAMPILQQPDNNSNFVSGEPGVATQFRAAERFHTVGLLAHNYLAGEQFYQVAPASVVILVYGDGSLRYYQVQEVLRYQALSPNSPQSDFIDLSDPNSRKLSAGDVFNRVYTQGDRVVFQTCILNEGDASWGRMFVIATPLSNAPVSYSIPKQPQMSTVL